MIASFSDPAAEALFTAGPAAKLKRLPPDIRAAARRKLLQIAASVDLRDLNTPPGNRLESLSGDLKGLYSIRINDQWRIVFKWTGSDAHDVRIIDYHR